MSGGQPVKPQRREIEIMRVLFDRRLKERAIALADSRWPGSGRMVDLAYDWGQMSPAQRREQLSAIGPEEIARLREFSALNPELSAAVDELDRRGVLPHIEAAAADATAAAQAAYPADQQEPQPAPANDEAEIAPSQAHMREREHDHAPEQRAETEAAEAAAAAIERPPAEFDFEDAGVDVIDVDMPELDLGLPSTAEFLDEQEERRQQAVASAEAMMDRVRQRLERSTQRAFERGSAFNGPKLPEVARPAALPALSELTPSEDDRQGDLAIEPPASLAQALKTRIVTSLGPAERRPTDDELVALANELQIGYTEFTFEPGKRRELFGGLQSANGAINVVPGPLPRAIAEPNLIVIRGRLFPQTARRIEQGFFDIPGTRATVRVHPDTRVLVLPT